MVRERSRKREKKKKREKKTSLKSPVRVGRRAVVGEFADGGRKNTTHLSFEEKDNKLTRAVTHFCRYRFRCLNQPRSRHRSRSSLSGFNQLQGQILNLYPSLPNNNVPSST